jgi:undecaprenyl-phosphate 4-deoxy-4-formamido-L-arabinose transferase
MNATETIQLQHCVSVVVPVYNSQESLPLLIERLEPVIRPEQTGSEVILVDDGSVDQSWQVIERLAIAHPFVRGMRLMRNYGQHNALLSGIRAAHHDVVVTIDDDLQNPPEEIPKLLSRLDEGYDVVYGTPAREQHGLWRDVASRTTKLVLQKAMGAATAEKISAFRAFRTRLRESFEAYRGPYVSIDVMLTWGTTRFALVVVRHEPRMIGVSNYTLGRLVRHAVNMLTGFTAIPLRLASIVGFVFTGVGFLLLMFVIGRYLIEGTEVPGFAFLACTVTILSGAQLFVIGIIGEYLARMHFRLMDQPAYVVSSWTVSAAERGQAPGHMTSSRHK